MSERPLERGSDDRSAWAPPPPARLRRQTTADAVAENLRQRVFDGALRPGDRINVEAIAGELGVSRVPVREALIGMARDGLMVIPPHKGVYVGDFDEGVLRDHFEILGMVQGMAAAHLVEVGGPVVVGRLREIVERLVSSQEPDEIHMLGTEFHRIINFEGGTSRERGVLRALARMLPTGFILQIAGGAEVTRAGAQSIYHAIRSGSPDDARRACLDVQRARGELVIEHLNARGVLMQHTAARPSLN
jgi:DNA-binding GntR family transcriptional regulator